MATAVRRNRCALAPVVVALASIFIHRTRGVQIDAVDFSEQYRSTEDAVVFAADQTISSRLARLYNSGLDGTPLDVAEEQLPLEVNATLHAHALVWRELGGTLQRLLLWDAGFVATSSRSQLARVYVQCGLAMDEIVVPRDEFRSQGCASRLCGATLTSSGSCTTIRTKCAINGFQDGHDSAQVVLWSEEQPNSDLPYPTLFRIDSQSFVIHMLESGANANKESCPPTIRLAIPCESANSDLNASWCIPTPSGAIPPLLEALRSTANSNSNANEARPLLWVCVMSVAVVAGVMVMWSRHKLHALKQRVGDSKTEKQLQAPTTTTTTQLGSELAFVSVHTLSSAAPMVKPSRRSLATFSTCNEPSSSSSIADLLNASEVFLAFQRDPFVVKKRIPMEDITFSRRLCQGASGDVFIGHVYGQRVAIKQLLQLRRTELDDLESFAREIQLTATLDHPNVIGMVGVAWTTFQQLTLVLEYRSGGDLLNVIRKRGARWSWNAEKLFVAMGVAKGMVYLHGRGPHPLVHRDIKSRNILVDAATLEPALCDFGSSCTVSALDVLDSAAGTILWSAPEVICSQQYSVKADIFSFGIVLAELDTCTLPYTEERNSEGHVIRAVRIAHMVVENQIKPQLSTHCPRFIRELVMQCVQHEPDERPTAEQVLARLADAANDCAALWKSTAFGIESV